MAFDGLTVAALARELSERLTGGRVARIAQPEPDAIFLTIKTRQDTCRLMLSADASLPLCYLTDQNPPNPTVAPNFCMLLRKHMGNARILSVTQPGLERILDFELEHLNEMGDLCRRHLILELMGKHSNLIFCNEDLTIVDSIKRISAQMSSVREVLPGRTWFIPDTMNKLDPWKLDRESFAAHLRTLARPCAKAIYTSVTGFSPLMAEELCAQADIDSSLPANTLSEAEALHLAGQVCLLMEDVAAGQFSPAIYYRGDMPEEFSVCPLSSRLEEEKQNPELHHTDCESVSQMLSVYYEERNRMTRSRQKTADLRKVIQTHLERSLKKYDLQQRQLKDTEKREKYRLYGELLHTYGYSVPAGAKSTVVTNYYDNTELTIPLDETLSATDNAKRYFEKYNKQKRTYEALTTQIEETQSEIEHLQSIAAALSMPLEQEDLTEIRQEMVQYGYLKKAPVSGKKGKIKITSKPHHYISSDGFHMYVGKNNFQNDALTFHFAENNDMWFHAKKRPGSHVIVRTEGKELPDRTYEEAGQLAAYYSSGRDADKVEIDYVEKKQVKKPAGGKPGFVIYHTNYSLMAKPDISGLKEII